VREQIIPRGIISYKFPSDYKVFRKELDSVTNTAKKLRPEEFEPVEKNLVFVLMAFGTDTSKIIFQKIQEGCRRLNLSKVEKADNVVGSQSIRENIFKKLDRAEFVIADLTYERPNVYYELGYLHANGHPKKDIIQIAKKDTRVHFDISDLKTKFYIDEEEIPDLIYNEWKNSTPDYIK